MFQVDSAYADGDLDRAQRASTAAKKNIALFSFCWG